MIGEMPPPEDRREPGSPKRGAEQRFTLADPALRAISISAIVLVLGLLFLALYPLGNVQGGMGIHDFRNVQQYVLLFAVPLGLGPVVGIFLSVYVRPGTRWRFLWSCFAFFLVQFSALSGYLYFVPFFFIHGIPIPNPAGWGTMLASAGIATFTSLRADTMLGQVASRKKLSRFVAGASAAVLLGSSVALAPIFVTEWREAPAILDDRYELAWELSVPASQAHHGSGFWFPSRQTAPPGFHPPMESVEPQRASESEQAVFTTDRWIGLIRLSDGKPIWSREFTFRVPGDRPDAMGVYSVEDRIHVIVRGPFGDIHTFRKSDGEILWEAKDLGFKYGAIGNPRVGAVPTSNFIVATFADGRPGYMVIDSETGSVTEHGLPVPDGMRVPAVEIGLTRYTIGPAVVEGDAGTVAIFACFSDAEIVPDTGPGFPFPGERFLFGIDPETGDIAWQVEGVGNWHEDLQWPLQNVWFDRSAVVWTGGYGSTSVRVWDTATGDIRWSKDFPAGVAWACVGRHGVAVREVGSAVTFLDAQTGDVRWTHDPGTWEMYARFFLGDTLILGTSGSARTLSGIRASDGSIAFSLPNLPVYRICGVQDGGLIVELSGAGGAGVVRIDPETGEQTAYGSTDFAVSLDLEVSRYLLSVRKRMPDSEGDRQDVFKAQGELQLLNRFVYPVQTSGSLGEVTREGSIMVTAYDDEGDAYRVYLLRRR